jgi:hypothetical protein
MVMRLELTEEGDYSFYYHNDDGKVGINDNGKETEIDYLSDTRSWNYDFTFFKSLLNFYNNFSLKIYSTDREHSLSSSFEDNCVVIDGKRYGNSPALYACYDRNKNAFIWNAIEGKELIVYEHKL